MIDKIFKLKENNTNVLTEFIAGLTTFMAMSYIIFINPTILSETGMEYNSVYMATILASMIGTLILGLFANVPYVQSAGLGINALFTYTICGSLGYTWQQALAMVFICGFISFIITQHGQPGQSVRNILTILKLRKDYYETNKKITWHGAMWYDCGNLRSCIISSTGTLIWSSTNENWRSINAYANFVS